MSAASSTHPVDLQAVNDGLLALSSALLGGQVYEPTHPLIARQVDVASEALRRACQARGELLVMRVEDRVVCEGRCLPDSPKLLGGLFGSLSQRGIDGLKIRGSVRAEDVRRLLQALSQDDEPERVRHWGTTLLEPAYLAGNPHANASHAAGGGATRWTDAQEVRGAAESFAPIWSRVASGDPEGLGDDADAA